METVKLSKYRMICFTDAGRNILDRLAASMEGEAEYSKCDDAKAFAENAFRRGNTLIFIGAAGIAVRLIAPFVRDKTTDPAVIVIDERGEFVIPILSGHIGGGNPEARKIASYLGATPVITTATDVRGAFAVDVFAAKNDLYISDMKKAKEFTAGLLRTGTAYYCVDSRFRQYIHAASMPDEIRETEETGDIGEARANTVFISPGAAGSDTTSAAPGNDLLTLVPRCIVVGIGCRKGTDSGSLYSFVSKCMRSAGLSMHSIKAVASIDLKASEEGICSFARKLGVPFVTYSAEMLMEQKGDFDSSQFVRSITGADNVCERAVMAYGCSGILVPKTAENGMTFAAGIMEIRL